VPRYDYTTVGHVTADVLADGSRRVGGSAFYSALQAARLGQRTLIITQGVPPEIEQLLAPYRNEFELDVRPAAHTTALETAGAGSQRRQRVLAWAGPIEPPASLDTAILHLAPVARETPVRWRGRAEFIGLTAQGLVRAWAEPGAVVEHVPLLPAQLPERCDAIVIGRVEREACAWLIAAVNASRVAVDAAPDGEGPERDTLLAVTAEAAATSLYLPGAPPLEVAVPRVERSVDDLGAGDVFAAAFFVALREGRHPHEAVAFGNAAAAVRIGGAGAGAVGGREAISARDGIAS
jgi:1D-myo-inositol 3-kinase